jgi:hypothetical protein
MLRTTHVVGVFDQYISALGLLHAQVNDHPHDTPSISERDGHLSGEVLRLVALNTDNGMPLGILSILSRDETELHSLGTSQDTLNSPSSQLGAVVLHLSRNNSSSRGIELAPPVRSLSTSLSSRVKLVESLDRDILILFVLVSVNLSPNNHLDLVGLLLLGLERQVELSVPVGTRGKRLGLLGRVKGVGVLESLALGLVDNLACEILVDIGSLERERSRRVDSVGFVRIGWRVSSVLVDSDEIWICPIVRCVIRKRDARDFGYVPKGPPSRLSR